MKKVYLSMAQINLFAGLMLVASLPFIKTLIPAFSMFWVLTWILDGGPIRLTKIFPKNKFLWLVLSFYILHVIGLFYTKNMKEGWFDLEVKLTLLIFPLVAVSLNDLYKQYYYRILKIFLYACFLASLFCLANSIGNLIINNKNTFFYGDLSLFHHPSYFSMYISFSLLIVLYFFMNEINSLVNRVLYIGLILYFLGIAFLLSSKAGIITAFAAVLFYLVFMLLKKKRIINNLIWVCISLAGFFIAINNNERFQGATEVISHKIEKSTGDSNTSRIYLLKSALALLKTEFLIGTGTGDVKDELLKEYEKDNNSLALERKYNSHNQFLETFLTLGIAGISVLLLMFIIPLIRAFKNKDFIILGFLLIIGFNFLFEVMFNTIAGVLFFAVFYNLLMFLKKEIPLSDDSLFSTKN